MRKTCFSCFLQLPPATCFECVSDVSHTSYLSFYSMMIFCWHFGMPIPNLIGLFFKKKATKKLSNTSSSMKHLAHFIGVYFVLLFSIFHWNIYCKHRAYSIRKTTFVSYFTLKRKQHLNSRVYSSEGRFMLFHQNSGKIMGVWGQLGKLFQLMLYVIFMLNTGKSKFKKLMGSLTVFHLVIIWFGRNVASHYLVNYSAETNDSMFYVSDQKRCSSLVFSLILLGAFQ